jgi:2-keto-3-deoxy-L-fuconate dehydrogenase
VFNLTGKVAVITGGGSGIGRAIALTFARQGAELVVLDLDEAGARETVAAVAAAGGRAVAAACDVADSTRVSATFDQIVRDNQRIDILVNNAGVAHVGTIEQTGEEDFERLYRVNIKGVYLCSRAAVPVMVRQGGGVILNMASIVSLIGVAERFAYSM